MVLGPSPTLPGPGALWVGALPCVFLAPLHAHQASFALFFSSLLIKSVCFFNPLPLLSLV